MVPLKRHVYPQWSKGVHGVLLTPGLEGRRKEASPNLSSK